MAFEGNIQIRLFSEQDNIEELTKLLNKAYKPLSEKGFRYLGSYQDAAKTKERIESGECFVAVMDNIIIGTILYRSPTKAKGTEWTNQPFVASFGQFAVEPEFQQHGIGGKLITLVEERAKQDGAKEISLDTAEGATDLINYYSKKGYRFVGYTQWEITNYRSVLLSKNLEREEFKE